MNLHHPNTALLLKIRKNVPEDVGLRPYEIHGSDIPDIKQQQKTIRLSAAFRSHVLIKVISVKYLK
jgi:hypothetical protein